MAKRIVYCTSPLIFALSFFATLRKRLRDDELGGSNFSHRFNEIKQKIIRVIRAISGNKNQPQIITNYHKQYTTENTNLIHPNPICTNFNYDRSLVRDKKRLDFSSRVSFFVGVDGFEPPTLCL